MNNQDFVQARDIFVQEWFSQEMSLSTGLYQLIYDGRWRCAFASDDCFKVLGCREADFLDELIRLSVRTSYHSAEISIKDVLRALHRGEDIPAFICVRPLENGTLQYIKGTLFVIRREDDVLYIHGQITDVSDEQTRHTHSQDIQEMHRAGKDITGLHFFHYMVEGRRAVLSPEASKKTGYPEMIDNYPEWVVKRGFVSEENREAWFAFFDDIRQGKPTGTVDIVHRNKVTKIPKYYQLNFISQTDDEGNVESAVISQKDTTKEVEASTAQMMERAGFIKAIQIVFPEILSCNLTSRTCRVIHSVLDVPEELPLDAFLNIRLEGIAPEDRAAFRNQFFVDNILRAIEGGKDKFQLTYRGTGADGELHWLETVAVLPENPYNDDIVLFAVSRNVDQQKKEMEKLAKNEKIFDVTAQHSDRTLCYYEIKTRSARPWNEGNCGNCEMTHICLKKFGLGIFEGEDFILPDSREAAAQMVREIHAGVPFGMTNVHIAMPDDSQRWLEFKYSSLSDDEAPEAALISFKDVTEQHEHELAYMQYIQSIAANAEEELLYMESCLTEDEIQRLEGLVLTEKEKQMPGSHGELLDMLMEKGFLIEGDQTAVECLECDWLLRKYEDGERRVETDIQVRFPDDTLHWLDVENTLLVDPFTHHIKAFTRIRDITERKEETLSIRQRADYDTMTGLLRREVGQERIYKYLAEHTAPGGILMLVDLDNLKGINDNLGHIFGDKAIIGVAATLKEHFGEDSIVIRAGGDEFMVFLPGAGGSVSVVKESLSLLMTKLEGISLDDNNEWKIGCSIGCAVELPGTDTFESIFQRADIALYQVKRSGKNHFAFFAPEMLEKVQEFRLKKFLAKADNQNVIQHSLKEMGKVSMEDTMFHCLNILVREPEPDIAFELFLQAIGEYYQADRAYIMEFDPEKQVTNNTFEWCAPYITSLMDNLQGIPLSTIDDWICRLETKGEFYIDSVSKELEHDTTVYRILNGQGVKSVLAAPLQRNGQILGFVGVDNPDCCSHDLDLLRGVSHFVLEELEKLQLMGELRKVSYVDALTGLKNRNQYAEVLRKFDSIPPRTLGIIAVDINGLKEINNTYGHEYGDKVLKQVANILQEYFPKRTYRIGGDEFLILCTELSMEEFQESVVELRHALDDDKTCDVSVGFAWNFDEDIVDVNKLLRQADEMRHAEKQSYYHTVLSEGHRISRVGFADEVLKDIKEDRFVVHYQPQMNIHTGAVIGAEALVRKKGDDGSLIPPGKFIPFYEVGGVISHVDLFVLRTACAALKQWMERGYDLHISVNFSRVTLLEPYIVDVISGICAEYDIPHSYLTIEVTESIGKMNEQQLQDLIKTIKGAGFNISLDDFGSQYSNLAILASMDFDEVKFDRSLVSTLEENEKSRLVMESGLGLCRALKGTVSLAEGIETKGQLDLLTGYQCDYGQGYYFSRPIPLNEFDIFLKENSKK